MWLTPTWRTLGAFCSPCSTTPLPAAPPSSPPPQFVGVKLKGSFCPTWAYEAIPNPVSPPNLHQAMVARRRATRKAG